MESTQYERSISQQMYQTDAPPYRQTAVSIDLPLSILLSVVATVLVNGVIWMIRSRRS